MPKAELRFTTDGASTPIVTAWIYLKQGTQTTLLRTNANAVAMKLRNGATDATLPWEYTDRFVIDVPAQVDLLYSTGGRPIPDDVQRDRSDAFVRKDLALSPNPAPQPAQVAPNVPNTLVVVPQVTVQLPAIVLSLTTPSELSLWPLLWAPYEDSYYTDGIAQGAGWFAQQALHEGGNPPAPQRRPEERGLLVQGTIDARATGTRIKIWNVTNNRVVKLLDSASDTSTAGHDDVAATLTAGANPTDPKTFKRALYFLHPDESFGPIQIVVSSQGITPNPTVGSFAVHLVGLQGTLVDDFAANQDGSQMGPQRTEADERLVVDFTDSPGEGHAAYDGAYQQAYQAAYNATLQSLQNAPNLTQAQKESRAQRAGRQAGTQAGHQAALPVANAAQRGRGRIRRMIIDEIKATRSRQLARTQTDIIHNEMPMWMAEVHLVGVRKADLEDLMRRRKRTLQGPPTTLSFTYQWTVQMKWKGPDHGLPNTWYGQQHNIGAGGVFSYDRTFTSIWTANGEQTAAQVVTLRLDANDALAVDGDKAHTPFATVPVALPFPTTRRRVPAVWVNGQTRKWGRQSSANARDALVLEHQVAIVENGNEVMRGGDCIPKILSFTIETARVHVGVRPDGTTLFDPADPDVQPPMRRVHGQNAAAGTLVNAVDAVAQRFYAEHPAFNAMRAIRAGGWQRAVHFICTHESGSRQFDDRRTNAYYLRDTQSAFGNEKGMPFFGGPRGYGIGQKDPAPPLNAIFNYVEAIEVACDELMHDKAGRALNYLNGLNTNLDLPNDEGDRAALLREATRGYNGGREFIASKNVLAIRPSVSGDHRDYPNLALQTAVPYANLDPPTNANHIAWIPAYYGPGAGPAP